MIHEGAKVAAVSAEDAMEGFGAAPFGFEYICYVRANLLDGKSH